MICSQAHKFPQLMKKYDKIIIGAGLYGLYAARYCGLLGQRVLVLERDRAAFTRATYINQARVHMGYHYPRSYATAIKSAHYFDRFCRDFSFCIHQQFRQIYATSTHFSWTNAEGFVRFCHAAGIRCETINPSNFFRQGTCDGAFETEEYTYDASILRHWFIDQLEKISSVEIRYGVKPVRISNLGDDWELTYSDGKKAIASYILNATYAGVNDIHALADLPPFPIKYEKCEIILCKVNDRLQGIGFTVMDGPFFSIMPFGKTGLHSLTSVTFTPHETSYDHVATFSCQDRSGGLCKPGSLHNCNGCPAKPDSAWPYMSQLARKFLRDEYSFTYHSSLFSMKPILRASEIDDSRPTVICRLHANPDFYSVLSGKINTVYDLDDILK